MISILVGTAAFTAGPALSLGGYDCAKPITSDARAAASPQSCSPPTGTAMVRAKGSTERRSPRARHAASFAEFNGGGSAAVSSGVQAKWAQGGDNHMRRANPTDTRHDVGANITMPPASNPRLRMAHADLVRPH